MKDKETKANRRHWLHLLEEQLRSVSSRPKLHSRQAKDKNTRSKTIITKIKRPSWFRTKRHCSKMQNCFCSKRTDGLEDRSKINELVNAFGPVFC